MVVIGDWPIWNYVLPEVLRVDRWNVMESPGAP